MKNCKSFKHGEPEYSVYCKPDVKNGEVRFYLCERSANSYREIWMFSNRYDYRLYNYYRHEVSVSHALDKSNAGKERSILNVMEKLPKWIKYVEATEGITVLNKSIRKQKASHSIASYARKDKDAAGYCSKIVFSDYYVA